MSIPNLERTAALVEVFLNAARLPEGAARTGIEARLVRWLSARSRGKSDCAIHDGQSIECYRAGRSVKRFETPGLLRPEWLWCDGRDFSRLDGEAFQRGGKIVLLGREGLDFSLPEREEPGGESLAAPTDSEEKSHGASL